jgi:hypothetical protein
MSTPYTYTPCDDERYKRCGNYAGFNWMFGGNMDTCENCKRNHTYKKLEVFNNEKIKDNYLQNERQE